MIKQVYVKKNGTVWRLSVSAWLGVCKDAINSGYALPDECVVEEGCEAEPDSTMLNIQGWTANDFKDWMEAHWRGEIKPKNPEPIVPKKVDPLVNPQDHWVDTNPVIIEAPAKPKKTRGKKK